MPPPYAFACMHLLSDEASSRTAPFQNFYNFQPLHVATVTQIKFLANISAVIPNKNLHNNEDIDEEGDNDGGIRRGAGKRFSQRRSDRGLW